MAIPITLRKKIADFDPIREGITVQQFCKNIGVSKQTYYNIKACIAERGRAGIVPDSTAPLNPRRVYDDKIRQQVLQARGALQARGQDCGLWSIFYFFLDELGYEQPPSRALIAQWLHEAGVADINARKRPRKSYRQTAFGKTVIDIANDPAFDTWTFSQKVLYALDKEVAARRERRINKLLKASRSPNLDACLENVVCTPARNINPEQISRLAHGQWCHLGQNIVILGKSSVGKTYLAQALINAACRNDYSASFYRTDMLATQLAVLQPDDPTWLKFIEQLHNVDVLVLDDFLTTPIDAATAHQIFNILAAREHTGSTIVTSQFTPKDWYASIPDAVIAESILNRLVVGAEIITLEGPNMRLEANE